MGSKVSPITNIKQIQVYLQEESKTIKYQTIIFKVNIGEDIKNVGPPTKVHITFARIDSMNPIVWNHEVCSCLLRIKKNQENRLKIK